MYHSVLCIRTPTRPKQYVHSTPNRYRDVVLSAESNTISDGKEYGPSPLDGISCKDDAEYNTFKKQLAEKYDRIERQCRTHLFRLRRATSPKATKRHKANILDEILEEFDWHKETDEDTKAYIVDQIEHVMEYGFDAAKQMAMLFESYQTRMGRFKYDVGRIEGVEYHIHPKPTLVPLMLKANTNLNPDKEAAMVQEVRALEKYG